jgi:hypothetical protein
MQVLFSATFHRHHQRHYHHDDFLEAVPPRSRGSFICAPTGLNTSTPLFRLLSPPQGRFRAWHLAGSEPDLRTAGSASTFEAHTALSHLFVGIASLASRFTMEAHEEVEAGFFERERDRLIQDISKVRPLLSPCTLLLLLSTFFPCTKTDDLCGL